MRHPFFLCLGSEPTVLNLLKTQLAQHFPDCRLEIAPSVAAALTWVEDCLTTTTELPVVIADQALLDHEEAVFLQTLSDRHPAILTVLLAAAASPARVSLEGYGDRVYRVLPNPWQPEDLTFTVATALRSYQQDQQLAQCQMALEHAQVARVAVKAEGTPSPAQPHDPSQREQQLETQCNLLRAILDNIPHIAWVKDCEGRFLLANAAFGAFYGVAVPALVGQTDDDIWSAELATACRNDDAAVIASGQMQRVEAPLQMADGTSRWIDTIKAPIYRNTGELLGTVGIAIDTTERKQLEQELRASEAKFADILNSSNAGIVSFRLLSDDSWDYDYYSAGCERLYGYSLQELMENQDLWRSRVLPEDFEAMIIPAFQAIYAGVTEQTIEYRFRHRDSSIRWVAETIMARWKDDQHCWLVTVVGVDISDRKQAELALQASEALQAAIIQTLPDLFLRMQPDGSYQELSLGQSIQVLRSDPPTLPLHIQGVLPDAMVEQRLHNIQIALQTQQMQGYEQTFEHGHQTRYEEVRLVPMSDHDVLVMIRDITKRRQAEIDLQQSDARFREISDVSPANIYILVMRPDGSFYFEHISRAIEAIHELTVDEILADASLLLDAIHPDDRPGYEAALQASIETCEPFKYEWRLITASGKVRWVQGNSQPQRRANGEIAWYGVVLDIQDRKQAEAALLQSEERRRLALDLTETSSWEFDVATGEAIWSDSHYRLMGLDPGSQVSCYQTWRDRFHPDDRVQTEQAFQQSLDTQMPLVMEYRVVHPDGTVRWALTKGQGVYDAAGNAVRMLGVMMDITDRKQAELALQQLNDELDQRVQRRTQALQQAYTQLKDSETRFQGFMNNSPAAAWISDTQGTMAYANPIYYQIHQVPVADVVGQSLFELYPSDIAQQFLDNIQTVESTQQALEAIEVAPRPDGSLGDFLVYKFPISDSAGQHWVGGVSIDITERRRATEVIRRSQEQLQLALDGSGDGLWDWDIATGECYYSPRWLSILGYDVGELPSQLETWKQVIHPDDYAGAIAILNAHLADPTIPYQLEYRARAKDGSWRWVASYGDVVATDAAGHPVRMAGLDRDITDRKRVEIALQRSETDLRTIFNHVYDAIFIHDLDGAILDVNDRALEFLGGTREQILASSIAEITAPGALIEQLPGFLERLRAGEKFQIEWRHRRFNDGSSFDSEVSLQQVMLGDRPVILAGARDISDRKQAEQALQESRNMLELVLDTTPQRVFWKDRQSVFLGCNRIFAQDYDLTPEEIIGKTDFELPCSGRGDGYRADDARVIETQCSNLYAEEPTTNLAGEPIWIRASKIPLTNSQGEVLGVLGCYDDITDRKHTEQQLQSEQFRLQVALESAQMGIWESDLDTEFWSAQTEAIFGYAAGTFPGDRAAFLQLLHPEDHDRVFAALAHSFATQAPYTMEYRINRLDDGELRWVAVNGKVLDQADGTTSPRMIGVVVDITERKQAEQALQDSEERLRLALMASNQGLFDLNVQTGETVVSSEYATMTGYDPAIFQEHRDHWLARLHPDDRERADALLSAYIAGEAPDYRIEFRLQAQSGEWQWILSMGKIVAWDEAGQPLRMLGTHTDIGDRKRAEAQLRKQEQFLRSIYEGVNQPIFVADVLPTQVLRYVGWNPAAAAIVGQSSESIAGKSIAEIFEADRATEIAHRCRQCIAARQPRTFETYITFQSETRWILTTYNPLISPEGHVYRIVGTVYDITDRKQAEDALHRLNQELEQRVTLRTIELQQAMEAAEAANRAKSTFLANMSHELRTPLNAILGFSQLLFHDPQIEGENRQQLSIINRSGEHLLNLINDILEMSKIEAGRAVLAVSCFDLHRLLVTLEELFQLWASQKQIRLIVEYTPSTPRHIETDENKLRQVLINLVSNAIKFTQAGQVRLRVSPLLPNGEGDVAEYQGIHPSTLTLRFAVEDTGVGIDPLEIESLFEPFTQSKNRQVHQEGTGLGLPISRQFAQLMGGELTAESSLGNGSTFACLIPVHLAEGLETPVAHPSRILQLAPNQPPYRILVAEDNDSNRQLLVQLLETIGFDVQAASNGQEAIARWETWQPQLIWMDICMPLMDGYEVTQQIRQRETQRAQPPTIVIALTASVFEEDRAKVLDSGCNDFMCKPFQETKLLEKIADYLGVQYLYADAEPMIGDKKVISFNAIAALRLLPTPILSQLEQATIQLNSQQLNHIIDQIAAEHPALAAFLTERVNNFDLDQILILVQDASPT